MDITCSRHDIFPFHDALYLSYFQRSTVAGRRLSGSPEKEKSPAKKSVTPFVDSEDSEREDDDKNQDEGKKKKYTKVKKL